jgi:DNA invertase Pin-like site-specific DNA recombinase
MNTASAMGRMFLTLMAAELERNLVAERTASVLAHKKQQSRPAIGSDSMPNSGTTR